MTHRLYYEDSELREFQTIVRTCSYTGQRTEVILDRTAFYPSSGGQPFDTGTLGGLAVIDVEDGAEGEVVHVVEGSLEAGSEVTGRIDWPRRVDHMQQHTGQHLLSAALERTCGVKTLSFHMGREVSTIDLEREVTADELAAAEDEANAVVWENRPVQVRIVAEEEAARLPLRKEPARRGPLRIVEIPEFDLSACGGTHVSRTGAVGVIAVSGSERFKAGTRVSFVCGGRALASYRRSRATVSEVARLLSAGPDEVGRSIQRLQNESRELDKHVRRLSEELLVHRAAGWREAAETAGRHRVVLQVCDDLDMPGLKAAALAITSASGLIAVLAGHDGGGPRPVVVARSSDVDLDVSVILKAALAAFGGRGGGRPELAQGGVNASSEVFFSFVRDALAT